MKNRLARRTVVTERHHAERAQRVMRLVAAGLVKPSLTMGSDLSDSARGLAGHVRADRAFGTDVRHFPATLVRHH